MIWLYIVCALLVGYKVGVAVEAIRMAKAVANIRIKKARQSYLKEIENEEIASRGSTSTDPDQLRA